MKNLLSIIAILATFASVTPALARSIDELDRPINLTANVLNHSIDPIVRDHQSDHDASGNVVYLGATPELQNDSRMSVDRKVGVNMQALRQHCQLFQLFHMQDSTLCGQGFKR